MIVKIADSCVACGFCIDEYLVNAAVDDANNPEGEDRHHVYSNKCIEYIGYNDQPACANVCPTDGYIVWSGVALEQPGREDTSSNTRSGSTPVFAWNVKASSH